MPLKGGKHRAPTSHLTQVITLGAVIMAITLSIVALDEPPRQATAKAPGEQPCAVNAHNVGKDMVFGDGTTLFATVNRIRCELKQDFTLISLAATDHQVCYTGDKRIHSIINGREANVRECTHNHLVVTERAGQQLGEQSREMRWLTLTAGAAQLLFEKVEFQSLLCVSGFVIDAQSDLDTNRLISETRQKNATQAEIDMILAGVWLGVNDLPFSFCVNPQPWHNPRAEVTNAASPGLSGARPAFLFQEMNT